MIPDPVVVDVRDPAVPRACADVLCTSAPTFAEGRSDAGRWFEQLPGLTVVAVALPHERVVFLGGRGGVRCATAWQPITEHVYASWVVSWMRTSSACGDPSDR